MRKSGSSQSPKGKGQQEKVVYRLTPPTLMKFRPERTPDDTSSSGLISRIKSLSKYFSREERTRGESLRKSTGEQGGIAPREEEGLRFLFRLDGETFLIGNTRQLDAIGVSAVEDYVESEQLWSLRGRSPFLRLLVDDRRKALVAVLQGQIDVYAYEGRKSRVPPRLMKSLRAVGEVRALQLARDSLLVFFEEAVQSYVLDGANSRQTSRKEYRMERSLRLLQVGQCVDGVLPVIFSRPCVGGKLQLFCLPVEVIGDRVAVGEAGKVYEVDARQVEGLRVESVDRDTFLMNLGQEILMFRKGYLVERVRITQKVDGTHLKYFGDRVLVHVSTRQLDFYEVAIDLAATPPKLALQSFDCVTLPPLPHYSFLDAVRLQPHRLAFFYHLPRGNSSGERKYAFALTQPWQFQQKVASLLPRISDYPGKYEGVEFNRLLEEIAVGCDLVGKMGVSRRDAYLRVWRQSRKEQVEEFKLLLDTLDYTTVREEIQLKLRKKAMLFNEVHKVEAGCLGMLAQSLFGPRHTQDDLKNYLVSHFLMRKLELLRDLRLYARRTGKGRTEEGERKDKLFIDIQDYSSAVQMDVRGYLLELVYSLVKHRKDVATEIRLILRKFRFPLRFAYESLLRDIVLTAKDDLLFLLKTLPELLPLAPPILPDAEEVALRSGVWGAVLEEDWESALHLETVATIYNREAVGEFGSSLWVKRYWLTQHDMLFHSRATIQAQRVRTDGGHLFYGFLEVLFQQVGGGCAPEVVAFLEETYLELPAQLFNNVLLYRALFEYLRGSGGMEEGFAGWLRRSDQEIFKRLFELEKVRKGSLLREVKPIYQGLHQADRFNLGLLRYFSSGVSEVSDIKYLLNRINNEKREFHDQNIEMYEVLVKGMQIKLRLGSTHDIPISEVLIYIANIPLAHDHAVSHQLALLQAINTHTRRFQHMRLNMSVFQIIRNRHAVLMATVAYEVDQAHMNPDSNELIEKAGRILGDLAVLRASIYGPFQDNELLFHLLAKLAEREELIPLLPQIAHKCALPDTPFHPSDLESLVFYCYRRQLSRHPRYSQSKAYLQALIALLPEENSLRTFIDAELELGLLFSKGQQQVHFPLCGETGIITTHHIATLMEGLPLAALEALQVESVWQMGSTLERIAGGSSITLSGLHQLHFCALVRRGALRRSLDSIAALIALQPDDTVNIVYPLMVFRRISYEFTEENKGLMLNLMGLLFRKSSLLLGVLQQLMGQSFSNDDKRAFLAEATATHSLPPQQRFKMDNPLFNDDFLEHLKTHPEDAERVTQLLQMQLGHMLRCSEDWARNVDIPIYHLLTTHDPILILTYLQLGGQAVSLKEARCFLSHLCKYPAYDPLKLLQFSKRTFKAMHDLQRREGQLRELTDDLLSSPLLQGRTVEQLDASTDNLAKLSKCVEKVKAKLKYRLASSSSLRRRSSISSEPSRQQQITDFLNDPHKYFQKCEYPFNDSDSYVQRKECLVEEQMRQAEAPSFLAKKYLTWLLNRSNQSIEYYLLRENEAEADQAVRQQEEALKSSFRTTPHDRPFKQHANIVVRTFQRISEGRDLGMLTESAIPAVPSSAISLKDIFPEVVEEVSLGASMLKDDILRSMRVEEEGLLFDSKLIQQFGTPHQIETVLPDLLRDIYHDSSLDYATAVALLREIHHNFPKLSPVTAAWVQVYAKVEQLQRKLGLTLDPRQVLPFQGLLMRDKDAGAVLGVVKGALQGQLNDNNIHTLSRVLALAFQRPEFQQHIINDYFGVILQEFSQLGNELDQTMKLEKIVAFARKMPLAQLKLEVERIIGGMGDPHKQRRVVRAISDILRQRNDAKNADLLETKWLEKSPLSCPDSE